MKRFLDKKNLSSYGCGFLLIILAVVLLNIINKYKPFIYLCELDADIAYSCMHDAMSENDMANFDYGVEGRYYVNGRWVGYVLSETFAWDLGPGFEPDTRYYAFDFSKLSDGEYPITGVSESDLKDVTSGFDLIGVRMPASLLDGKTPQQHTRLKDFDFAVCYADGYLMSLDYNLTLGDEDSINCCTVTHYHEDGDWVGYLSEYAYNDGSYAGYVLTDFRRDDGDSIVECIFDGKPAVDYDSIDFSGLPDDAYTYVERSTSGNYPFVLCYEDESIYESKYGNIYVNEDYLYHEFESD